MPALVVPLLGFALGATFGWLAIGETSGREARARGAIAALWFGFLVLGPTGGYLLAFYPDWSLGYVFDVAATGPAPLLALSLIATVSPVLGFLAGLRAVGPERNPERARLLGIPLLLALGLLLFRPTRLRTFGTYAQFQGGFGTQAVAGSPLGYALLLAAIVIAAGALWTGRTLFLARASRRPD